MFGLSANIKRDKDGLGTGVFVGTVVAVGGTGVEVGGGSSVGAEVGAGWDVGAGAAGVGDAHAAKMTIKLTSKAARETRTRRMDVTS